MYRRDTGIRGYLNDKKEGAGDDKSTAIKLREREVKIGQKI